MSRATTAVHVRPLTEADIPQAAVVSAESFDMEITTAVARRNWQERIRHSLITDPEGSVVTERGGVVNGIAQAVIRDGIWILSLLSVSPSLGTGGEGRALVQSALEYYGNCTGGLVIASNDPRALRLYGSSGFALEPTFKATGAVDSDLLPDPHPGITAVQPADFGTLAPISRAVRGAAHTRDLGVALMRGASVFRLSDRGYVITMRGRGIWALAARDEPTASDLLRFGLAQVRDETQIEVGWISGRQQWAIDVVLSARLSLTAYGAIATRGATGPMHPYIPSPSFA